MNTNHSNETDLISASNSLETNVTKFNKSHEYITFSAAQPSSTTSNSLIFSTSKMCFMTQKSESDTTNPVTMALLDKNIYDMDTAAYNSSLYFAAMKRAEQDAIRSSQNVLTTIEGLRYVILPGFCGDDAGFFQRVKTGVNKTQEGFESHKKSTNDYGTQKYSDSYNNNEGVIEDSAIVEGFTERNNDYSSGLTCTLVKGYMNDKLDFFSAEKLTELYISSKGKVQSSLITDFTSIDTATNNDIRTNNNQHYWSGLWTGVFICDTEGEWRWFMASDDCSYLWINGNIVINNGGAHGNKEVTGSIKMVKGVTYKISVIMAEQGGGYNLTLSFIRPRTNNRVSDGRGLYFTVAQRPGISGNSLSGLVKGLKLSAVKGGFMGYDMNYFEGKAVDNNSIYSSDFTNIGTATKNVVPDDGSYGIGSAQWKGFFLAQTTGMYIFGITSDDVGYIFIDDIRVVGVDSWISKNTYKVGTISLVAGRYYPITYLWGNSGGPYSLGMYFCEPSTNIRIKNGDSHYFSKAPILHTFDQNSIPRGVNYSSLYGLFTSTEPIQVVVDDVAMVIYPNIYNSKIKTVSTIDLTPINNKSATMSMEWFGYFQPTVTGTFTFTLKSNSSITYSSMLWVGDNALVSYTGKNANTITGIGSKSVTTGKNFQAIANRKYPIRILYGQKESNGSFDFKISINTIQSSGISTILSDKGTGYFCFLLDKENNQYEPIQMAMALRDDTGSNAVLKSCYVSPININNNYQNNSNLRKAKVMQNIQYSKYIITKNSTIGNAVCSLILKPNGDLTFNNAASATTPIWSSNSMRSNCDASTMGSGLNNDVTISNINVVNADSISDSLMGFFSIASNSTINPQPRKPKYAHISFIFDTNAYNMRYPNSNINRFKVTYNIGSQVNEKIMNNGSEMFINNMVETNASFDAIQNAVNTATNDCRFTLTVTDTGDISIVSKSKQEVYNLKIMFPANITTDKLAPVDEWLFDSKKNRYFTMTSASYIPDFDSRKNVSSTLGIGGNIPYLYSTNCKFKLMIESNNLVIKYAIRSPRSTTTNNDGSNTFILYSVFADEKLGQSFVQNTQTHNMYPIKENDASFFKRGNTYTKSNSDYSFPPSSIDTDVVDPRSYNSHINMSLANCQRICNAETNCSHLYSYKTKDGNTNCMINSDSKDPKYYINSNPIINTSEMYIRDRMVDSSCSYSFDPYTDNGRQISYRADESKYASFENEGYTILRNDTLMPKTLSPSTEGACGNPLIYNQSVNLVGARDDGIYGFNHHTVKEGLEGASETRSSLIPLTEKEKNAKSIYIPGYKTVNHCNDLSAISGNAGYLQNCISAIDNNINAINIYSEQYKLNNVKIDKNYRDISDMTRDVSSLYTSVNNPTPNDIFNAAKDPANRYDPIDYSGNLIYNYGLKQSPELKDAMLEDMNQDIIQQNAMYVIGTITIASLLIFILMISK